MDDGGPGLLPFDVPGVVPAGILSVTAVIGIFKARRHGGRHGIEA